MADTAPEAAPPREDVDDDDDDEGNDEARPVSAHACRPRCQVPALFFTRLQLTVACSPRCNVQMADFLDDLDSDDSDDELTLPGAVKPMLGSQEVKEVTMPAEAAAAPEGEPRQAPSPRPAL